MIGTTIGHYRIEAKLGEGGMGVVYKATDAKLNRTVALKLLPERVQKDSEAKARFLQEAQAAASLNHPNICTIYGVDEQNGQLYMAMELIEGGTLRDILGSLIGKVTDAVGMAVQIGDALQEAHAIGIVHRDIKADNVMVTKRGQAKVMDFGLAKLKGALKLTRTSSTVGTLGYMAPEQIQGSEVDPRSDIFSTGVLLFEMLTGHLPFRGEHEAAMMYSILNEAPRPVQDYIPDASPDLSHILARALEKDPADRYQSMADMVSELRRLLKQSSKISRASIPAMPASPTPSTATMALPTTPPPSSPPRRGTLIGAAIAAVALVSAVAVYFFVSSASVELNPLMAIKVLDVPVPDIDYPGLSGDGNWITFTANSREGVGRLYLMNTGGGEPRAVLADSGLWYRNADLSFDASKIIFLGWRNGPPSIYISSALGGGTRVLADSALVPRWQPDGNRVFFLRPTSFDATGRVDIWSIGADGRDARLEVPDAVGTAIRGMGRISLSVSHDGGSIVWLRTFLPDGYQEIFVRDRKTGDERQLTFDKKNIDEVCWASNDQILFSSNRSGNTNLWMVPSTGGMPVQITKGGGPDLGIRVSKDNSKLLYYVHEEIGNLWSASLKAGTAHQLSDDDKVRYGARLSPDGRQIAYVMQGNDIMRPMRAIYVSNRDGSGKIEITNPAIDFVRSPMWSPDGRRIAYGYRDSKDSALADYTHIVDIARPGTGRRIGTGSPFLWLDDDHILTSSVRGTRLIKISTGSETRIFRDSTVGFPVKGETHFFYRDHHAGRGGRWIVRVDKSLAPIGEPRKIMDIVPFWTSPTRDEVVYLDGKDIWRVRLPSGEKQRIRNTFTGLSAQADFTVNPSTQEIIYSVTRRRAKLVMIENPFK